MSSSLPPLATLWLSGALSPLERSCLRSMLAQGHEVHLYSYGPLAGVPEGVIQCDAREVFDIGSWREGMTLPAAMIADIFRLNLFRVSDAVWVDSDVFCVAPIQFEQPYVMGTIVSGRVNNAVLRLPSDAPEIGAMLGHFESVRQTLPGAGPEATFADFEAIMDRIQTREMNRGDFGPRLLSKQLRRNARADLAMTRAVFYPVDFQEAVALIRRDGAQVVETMFTDNTVAVHLWASALRKFSLKPRFADMSGSYLDIAFARYGERWQDWADPA